MARPIAILGGTFDPVHNAHLAIARRALEALDAQQVLFIPTGHPRYRQRAVASDAHRLAMLRLALAGEPRFAIDARELAPGASGYTIDTLLSLGRDFPGAKLVLLMGADQYEKRHGWHRWADIEKRCELAVFARAGRRIDEGVNAIQMPPLPISASDIRARLARGEDVAALVPPPVAAYIAREGLYR
ncbi:MAG: nicotinate (nicotinamide) nucleotide adenylyltransferase [Pseudomonadota bacterium]